MKICKICKKQFDTESYIARETRYGWGDEFVYYQCPHCGCVQIENIPEDLGQYYSSEYYSLNSQTIDKQSSAFHRFLRFHLLKYRLTNKGVIGKLIAKKQPDSFAWIKSGFFNFSSSLLDVGCGMGRMILKLAESGFKNVQGIDPYLEKNFCHKVNNTDVHIFKKSILEIEEKYDVITLMHVLEHLENPLESIKSLSQSLNPNGIIVLALPMHSEFIWNYYHTESCQYADAPRHLFIHTLDSLNTLFNPHNLYLVHSQFYYYDKLFKNVYDQMHEDFTKMDLSNLSHDLIVKQDSGFAYLYYRLEK